MGSGTWGGVVHVVGALVHGPPSRPWLCVCIAPCAPVVCAGRALARDPLAMHNLPFCTHAPGPMPPGTFTMLGPKRSQPWGPLNMSLPSPLISIKLVLLWKTVHCLASRCLRPTRHPSWLGRNSSHNAAYLTGWTAPHSSKNTPPRSHLSTAATGTPPPDFRLSQNPP